MGQDLGEQPRQRRPRLEQPEQIDAARQALDDVAQAVERVIGIGARGERLDQARKHRLECLLRRRRTERARLARAPVGDVPRGRRRCRRIQRCRARRVRMSGSLDNCPRSSGARLSKISPARSTCGRRRSSRAAPLVEAVQPRDIVERGRIAPAADASGHRRPSATRCSIVRSSAIGFGERRGGRFRRAGPPQPSAAIASSVAGDADRGIAAAVDHLLDLDEEFDLANAATPALQVVARADPRVLRKMVADPRRDLAGLPRSRRNRASGATRTARSRRGNR